MLSEKSKQTINHSTFKEVYELMMTIPHNEYSYIKAIHVCEFMNADSPRMDLSIVNEIFADYLCIVNNNNNINGGVNYD